MNYAVINSEGVVVNAIVWDGIAPWTPPAGHTVKPLLDGAIGWRFIEGRFVAPTGEQPPNSTATETL